MFFTGFKVSQPCASVSQLPAALRRPQKKHAPGILEHVSCGFCHFLTISGPPKPFAAVSQLPAALRLPQKKHAPGFLEHVSCGFSQFSSILGSPKWYRHRMTPTATATATTSQQPPCPTATSKQTRTGTKYPVQGIPPHSDIYRE